MYTQKKSEIMNKINRYMNQNLTQVKESTHACPTFANMVPKIPAFTAHTSNLQTSTKLSSAPNASLRKS